MFDLQLVLESGEVVSINFVIMTQEYGMKLVKEYEATGQRVRLVNENNYIVYETGVTLGDPPV